VVTAVAVPQAFATIERSRTVAAARYVASRLALARSLAVNRATVVALRFEDTSNGLQIASYADGNENGVRTRDIASGIDAPVDPPVRLGDLFPRVQIANGAPGSTGTGVQLSGGSDLLSFTPLGTATSGSIYVRGPDGSQFVVRVLGTTGRARVLRYDEQQNDWVTAF
jgi:Tfp pilus assembly protein FimT